MRKERTGPVKKMEKQVRLTSRRHQDQKHSISEENTGRNQRGSFCQKNPKQFPNSLYILIDNIQSKHLVSHFQFLLWRLGLLKKFSLILFRVIGFQHCFSLRGDSFQRYGAFGHDGVKGFHFLVVEVDFIVWLWLYWLDF